MKTPLLITCLLLLIAILPMPFGYYQFLRIAITIVAGIIAYDLFETNKKLLFSIFLMIAVLYNPVIVIHLDRAIWTTLNIFTAVFFVIFAFVNKNNVKT